MIVNNICKMICWVSITFKQDLIIYSVTIKFNSSSNNVVDCYNLICRDIQANNMRNIIIKFVLYFIR